MAEERRIIINIAASSNEGPMQSCNVIIVIISIHENLVSHPKRFLRITAPLSDRMTQDFFRALGITPESMASNLVLLRQSVPEI